MVDPLLRMITINNTIRVPVDERLFALPVLRRYLSTPCLLMQVSG